MKLVSDTSDVLSFDDFSIFARITRQPHLLLFVIVDR